jgi:hypothetical protein
MTMNNIMIFSTMLLAVQLCGGSAKSFRRRLLAGVPEGFMPCLTEEQCRTQTAALRDAGIITGFLYAGDDFPTKGCIVKGGNVYFGSGGTVEEMSEPITGMKERLWCESTTFDRSISMSMPIQESEMSMSMPIQQSEMSMSMPLVTSQMNMPGANSDSVSPTSTPGDENSTGFFDNINITSAIDAVTDPVTDFFDNITVPFVNMSSGDNATEEAATPSGAVASSTLSLVTTFVVVAMTFVLSSANW